MDTRLIQTAWAVCVEAYRSSVGWLGDERFARDQIVAVALLK